MNHNLLFDHVKATVEFDGSTTKNQQHDTFGTVPTRQELQGQTERRTT
jgi:hypothetical protein